MQRYFWFIFKVAVAWCVLFALSQVILPEKAVQKADITIAIQTAPRTLDPFRATDASSVRLLQHITPALARFTEDFTLENSVAESITKTKEGYRVTLPQKHWHDGKMLTADDVKKLYQNLAETSTPYTSLTAPIQSIDLENDHTLFFTLNMDDPYHLKVFTVPLVRMEGTLPIGLGDWKIGAHKTLSNITLEHVRTHKTINVVSILSPDIRLMALRKGDVDIIHNDMPPELTLYAKKQGFNVFSAPSESYSYIGFNMQDPVTGQAWVRQAISLGIDRQAMISTLLAGQAEGALSLLMPANAAALSVPNTAYNPEQAQNILKAHGYTAETPLSITLSTTNSAFMHKLAQVMQDQLRPLGITLNIHSMEWGTFYENVKKGAVHMYMLTWVGAFDTDFLNTVYHSTMIPPEGANRGFYTDNTMDTLLDKMMITPKGETHNALAQQVQKQAAEAQIYIPLWRAHHMAITAPSITQYRIYPDGGYDLDALINAHP